MRSLVRLPISPFRQWVGLVTERSLVYKIPANERGNCKSGPSHRQTLERCTSSEPTDLPELLTMQRFSSIDSESLFSKKNFKNFYQIQIQLI